MTKQSGRLERMFTGQPPREFLDRFWPEHHLVCHGLLKRLAPLGELPEFADLALLLRRFPEQIRVALADKRDEHSSVMADAAAAEVHHREGRALILDGVERCMPEVQQWLGALREELGLPLKCNPRCIVYVSPPGSGNSPHFDANANFVVQLRGTKRWRLAPNQHVESPTDRWAMNQGDVPEELAEYVDRPFPTQMPRDAETIELKPGSVLFVPRGYWHATESGEDTLALNFTFGQPAWVDVVLAALRRRLVEKAPWRKLATGLRADEPKQLLAMLDELRGEVSALEVDEVIEANDAEAAYVLVAEAFMQLDDGAMTASLGARSVELDAPEAARPALQWIAQQGMPFTYEQLAQAFPALADELPAVFQQLRTVGLVTRARRPTRE